MLHAGGNGRFSGDFRDENNAQDEPAAMASPSSIGASVLPFEFVT
jgi:hypothetical protein